MNSNAADALHLPTTIATGDSGGRYRTDPPHVKINDPASLVMNDLTREPLWTIDENRRVDEVLDEMFRLGVRAFLVVRQQQVIGLITSDDVKPERLAAMQVSEPRVADVMTQAGDIPMIEWCTILDTCVRDLLEIFEGTHVAHLVVVESDSGSPARARGLIHRSRLERQLATHSHHP